MSLFDNARRYWRFVWKLREFLSEPMTLERSQQIIQQRLNNRDQNLLGIIRKAIYGNANSPYLKLLKITGCEYGDIEKMIRSDGAESALRELSDKGVYVSLDEFKARKEVVRGSKTLVFKENDFDNPLLAQDLEFSTGASRSVGTRTIYDLDFLKMHFSLYSVLALAACKSLDAPIALWGPIMPGWGPSNVLAYLQAKKNLVKWFCPVTAKAIRPSIKSRVGTNYIVYLSRILGAKCPKPEFVPVDHASQIAGWLAQVVKTHQQCFMVSIPSLAVRICQAARETGQNISGTTFFVGGEPTSEMKRNEIDAVGAKVCPLYAFVEGGWVGLGCMDPVAADDIHILKDSMAVIQHEKEFPNVGISVDAFQFTSLLPSTPKILFNLEIGDYGLSGTRNCGCYLGQIGLTDHFWNIRSFDKITGDGVTFIGVDLVRILDQILPSKFGGCSIDYQMIEEEDEHGHTRLSIVVSPDVGIINEEALIKVIYDELGRGKEVNRMMANIWYQSNTLRIKRMKPLTTKMGKFLPLHIQKDKHMRL